MTKFSVSVSVTISDVITVEAENAEDAKLDALEQFEPTGYAPQSKSYHAEPVEEPNERGFTEAELCPDHLMPFVSVRGKKLCPACQGAFGGND